MKKSKIKPHFFSLRREDYEKLLDMGMTNQSINLLRQNPARFFSEFGRYARNIPDEHKPELYMFCFQIATDKDRARIESIIYVRRTRKEVAV